MMTLFCIPNMERFLDLVERSCGRVLLHLPDNTFCDLKEDRTAAQLLRMVLPGEQGLRISLSDPKDLPSFLSYMAECAC